jgi:hypothetical protein
MGEGENFYVDFLGNPGIVCPVEESILQDDLIGFEEKMARLRNEEKAKAQFTLSLEQQIAERRIVVNTSLQSLFEGLKLENTDIEMINGQVIARVVLLDVPRRFKSRDVANLFEGHEFHEKALNESFTLPSIADLTPVVRKDFYTAINAVNVANGTCISPDKVFILVVPRARSEWRRMLMDRQYEDRPDLSGLRAAQPEVLAETFSLYGDGTWGIPCSGALSAAHWFADKLGRDMLAKQHQESGRGLLSVRGFWAVDGGRVRKEDIIRAQQIAAAHLGVRIGLTKIMEMTALAA